MNLGKFQRILSRSTPATTTQPTRQEQYIARLKTLSPYELRRECVGAIVTLADYDRSRSAMPRMLAGADLAWAEKRWSCCREECERRGMLELWDEAQEEAERKGI